MTSAQRLIGLTATLTIVSILLAVIANESRRQDVALEQHIDRSVNGAIEIYAQNCVECHGSAGAGFDIYPALNDETVNKKDPEQLHRTIERGKPGTEMAAFGINEGGMLSNVQIDSLVMLIQQARWDAVYMRVVQLNLLPTATPTPTATATFTLTLPPTPTATLTFTPFPTATVSDLFGVMPTAGGAPTEAQKTSPFDIVPTAGGTLTAGGVPTEDSNGTSPFDVVPTAGGTLTAGGAPTEAQNASPFDVVATESGDTGTIFQPIPTQSDD